ncbi:Serine/threonine protein kinase [Coemansia erecta]|uniref:non-specific serine/threonine protein kinase n=1 Tax=Coemansia asiatica TaxID=1052880 RepID=A0A9W7XK85_9FUNG|nr:Serine/threonine protein kinase [Coemansia asiatica]KAJ2853872.1 Serine/threonine protein kinase [Coemansia erecta]KAJ2886664.1 Serine/threonine protein kinase [Coemansia asiatica]
MPTAAYTRTQIHLSKSKPGAMVGHSIDNGNLQFVKLIGVGTYGEVYRTIDRRTGEIYAVKVLPRKPTSPTPCLLPTQQQQQRQQQATPPEEPFVDARLLSREVSLYARIPPHSNIVRLERMLHTQDQLFMVMENCSGGDLYENISNNPYFHLPGNDALIRRLFLQLVSAIEHCHKHGVFHRDIKPENVLVTRDSLNVKLIDFGLSTSDLWCREIGCGSAYYMSPECQGGINNSLDRYAAAPNDVWALGVILINLATGRNPWNRAHVSDPLFRRYLTDKSFLCRAIRATHQFEHIIHRVLDINPNTRCSLQELRQLVQGCPRFVEPASGTRLQQASPAYIVHKINNVKVPAAENEDPACGLNRQKQTTFTSPTTTTINAAGAAVAAPTTKSENKSKVVYDNGAAASAGVAQQQNRQENLAPVCFLQSQSPAESMSLSSTDSMLESMISDNRPLGYPPLSMRSFDKSRVIRSALALNASPPPAHAPAVSAATAAFSGR